MERERARYKMHNHDIRISKKHLKRRKPFKDKCNQIHDKATLIMN